VWVVTGIILAVIAVPQVFNAIYIDRVNRDIEFQTRIMDEEGPTATPVQPPAENVPIVSGGRMPEIQAQEERHLISSFISYANNGRIEEAYNLLSEESKEINFPTVQAFANNYHSRIFSEYRLYDIQMWIMDVGTTYRVRFLPDILSSRKCGRRNYYYRLHYSCKKFRW